MIAHLMYVFKVHGDTIPPDIWAKLSYKEREEVKAIRVEMKQKIIDVVEQYVEVDEDVPVDVKVKDDVKFGTVYGITVPVSKVKAEFDAENEAYMIGAQFVYDDETWEELKQETEEEEEDED